MTVSAISLLLAMAAAELVLRWRAIGPIPRPETSLHYRHDPLLGWRPGPHDTRTVLGAHLFQVSHNSDGFRDREHGPKTRPRILVLGDSFVWGFDVEQPERFTELVQQGLPGWELINAGVSGYGTDQEYLLLQEIFTKYQPDVVFVMFCADNDRLENSVNEAYGFSKPYFVRERGELALKGTPVPVAETFWFNDHPALFSIRLTRTIARALRHRRIIQVPDPTLDLMGLIERYVAARHVQLLVGLTLEDSELERYLAASRIPALTVPGDLERYPSFGLHWTPRSHQIVARLVLDALKPLLARAAH